MRSRSFVLNKGARTRPLALLRQLAAELPSLRTDAFRLSTLGLAAEAAVAVDDRPLAAVVLDALQGEPAANVIFGACGAYLGPRARYVGLAALGAGMIDDARSPNYVTRPTGFGPWAAALGWLGSSSTSRTHCSFGDGPGDRDQALLATTEAIEVGRSHAMTVLVELALATKLEAQGAVRSDVTSSIDVVAAAVSTDRPNLLSLLPDAEAGSTVTILFTDIVDSTRTAERIGDRRWLDALRTHNAVIRAELPRHQGVEVKARGDGFMLAFVERAVRFSARSRSSEHLRLSRSSSSPARRFKCGSVCTPVRRFRPSTICSAGT